MTSPKSRAAGAFSRDTALLRGGRLRKTNRGLLTFAPFLATASAVALGALLSLTPTNSAHAQTANDCVEDMTTSSTYLCSGSITAAESITADAGEDLIVTDTSGFSISASATNLLDFRGVSGQTMSIDLDGDITNTSTAAGTAALRAINRSSAGNITITTSGTITATGHEGANGIYVYHGGSSALTVTVDGTITAGRPIVVQGYTGGGSSVITVDIGGTVTSNDSSNPVAISMSYGSSHTLRLRDGASITGGITDGRRDSTLEILGSHSFDPPSSFIAISLASPADTTASTSDRLTVTNYTTGGTLTLNADFMADSAAADQLIITGTLTTGDNNGTATPTMITLMTTGELSDLPSDMPLTLVDVSGSTVGAAGDFALTNTDLSSAFSRNPATGDWIITGTGEPTVTPPPPTGNGGNGGGGMPDPDPVTVVENMCAEQSTGGTFICDGMVTADPDLSADMGKTLTVTATDDFTGITVTSGDALTLTGMTGSTGIDVTLGGTITAMSGDGISATHAGTGDVNITANAVTGTGNTGIDVTHSGSSGNVSITTNGAISGDTGISAEISGTDNTAGNITVTIGGAVNGMGDSAGTAIAMTGGGNHRLVINSGGSIADGDLVTSDVPADSATLALNAAAGETDAEFDLGDLENFHDGATEMGKAFTAFEKTGAGTWTLTGDQTMDSSNMPMDRAFTSASVMAGTLQLNGATLVLDDNDDDMATTAALEVASGATLQVMGDSASTIMGGLTNSGTLQVNADLTLGAMDMPDTLTNSGTLNITGATTISAVLTSSGTVEIAGTEAAPTTATITGNLSNSGTLNLDTATLNLSDNTLTNAGTMNIMGASTIDTGFTSPGTLNLDTATLALGTTAMPGTLTIASGGTLNITGSTTIMGILNTSAGTATATLGVNLTDPNAFTSERLTVSNSGSTGSVAIALNVTSTTDQELAAADLSGVTLVSGAGTGASALTFSAANEGNCTIVGNNGDCMFTIDSNGNLTSLTVMLAASDILYENYAASLVELSRVSGMRARFGNRIWATEEGRGIWARAEASNSELEPNTPSSDTSAAYEIRDTRLRFGVDAPIRAVPGLILGGNVWLARADTDITAADADDGKIETEGYALAATAHWQASTGFYVDGQAQFAAFTSDLSSAGETRVDGNDGRGITLAAEVGYPVPVREFTITPQAQLSWSDVDFDDFTASDNDARISLGDGETVDARIGVSVDRRWSERSGTLGHVWGAIDLRAPLDGETSARVDDGAPLISEREEPALGLGMGVSFLLRDNTSIAAELATTQGDEIEEYKGSLALRFTF